MFFATVVCAVMHGKDYVDISYYTGDAPAVGNIAYRNERCKLDLRIPDGKKNFPTLVWFHGGGLTSGKKYYPPCIDTTQIAIASVEYRLSGEKAKCPDYLYDAAAATVWVLKNIEKYGGSKDHIYVSGNSAGGYLTAMLALDKKYLQAFGSTPFQMAGFFPITGQMSTHFQILAERKATEPETRDFLIDEYAPIYYAAKKTPEMVFYCGDALLDWPARAEENQLIVMRMKRVYGNQHVKFFSISGTDHGTCTAPSLAMINNELIRICKQLAKQNKK